MRLIDKARDLSSLQRFALEQATRAMKSAYCPYSHFRVGACLYNDDAKAIITGANFENASYGLTICAERSAIFRANMEGMRCFHGIAIVTSFADGRSTEEPSFPCGACRQVLLELAQLSNCDLVVLTANTEQTKILQSSINELLPCAFGPIDLGINLAQYR